MIFKTSILLQLGGALVATQGLPQPTKVVARQAPQSTVTGINPLTYGTYGVDHSAQISHLEQAHELVNDLTDISRYLVTLLAFTKCNPLWIDSWYPNGSDVGEKSVLPPGQAYVLPFVPNEGKRSAVHVDLAHLSTIPVYGRAFDPALPDDTPWWPWALLKGVTSNVGSVLKQSSDPKNGTIFDFDEITHALSSFKVVQEDERDEEKLWNGAFKSSEWSPVWIETQDEGFSVVMSTSGEGDDRMVRYSRFDNGKIIHFDRSLHWTVDGIRRLTHLEGYPAYTGVRQGVWDAEPLLAIESSA